MLANINNINQCSSMLVQLKNDVKVVVGKQSGYITQHYGIFRKNNGQGAIGGKSTFKISFT